MPCACNGYVAEKVRVTMSMEGTVSWVGLSLMFLRREKDQQAVNALLLLKVGGSSHHMTLTLRAQCCLTLRADPELGGGSSLSFPFEISHPPTPSLIVPSTWITISGPGTCL